MRTEPSSTSSETPVESGNGLTIKTLRAFFWLARQKNYHAVARQLNVTQPAISARISMLEDELGVKLFSRAHQSIQLTPEGQEALRLCEQILDGVDRLAARFSAVREPSGIIRLGVVDSVARTWLPALLERLRISAPAVDLEITAESTVVLHSLLRAGALHMSVSISRCDDADIRNTEVGRYEMAWVGNPRLFDADQIYSRHQLIDLPMIGYLPETPPALWLNQYFGDDGGGPIYRNTTNSMSTMIWLAESGLGIAAIPPRAIHQYLADGRLAIVPTDRAFEPIPFFLSYRTRPHSAVVEAVKSAILAVAE